MTQSSIPLKALGYKLSSLMLAALTLFASSLYAQPTMYAHCINVGQADATLIEFPCGAVLIDAGSQDESYTDSLINYLNKFFLGRPDLNRTIDVVFITHNHIDHTQALKKVVETFNVVHYFDNGQLEGRGTANPVWIRKYSQSHNGIPAVKDISESEITSLGRKSGLTSADIDPIHCDDCDPVIRVLSGRRDDNPGWSDKEFDNKNNHSLVIRIDFSEASFLFTGDLEDDAIVSLLEFYDSSTILDADVYHVGHHGSNNGTTTELLEAVTPEIAVISCGPWNFGLNSKYQFTTYAYGHPRKSTLADLSVAIAGKRSQPLTVKAGLAARNFVQYTVKKKIYATAWDGSLRIKCTTNGGFTVARKQ